MVESCEKKFERWRRTGDTDALADVFDAIAPRLLRLAVHLVGDVSAAEDLVQSTFVSAIEDAAAWDPSRPLEPWLTGILDNRAKRLLKSRERSIEPAAREDVDHDTPLARAMEKETSSEIVKAVDQLDEPYRSVMVLSLLHHLEPAAIAHALDRSPGAVRVQLHRGREMVRKLLPAGVLTSALLFASSGRGLAAIKSAVLAQAHSISVITLAATTGGAFVLKNVGIAIVVIALLVTGATLVVRARLDDASHSKSAPQPGLASELPAGNGASDPQTEPTSSSPARAPATESPRIDVSGRVLDTPGYMLHTGTPAAGCEISVFLVTAEGAPLCDRVMLRTDEHGEFHVRLRRPADQVVYVRAESRADERACSAMTAVRAKPTSDVVADVLLERVARGTLHGITLDDHDEPLTGVSIRFKPWGHGVQPIDCTSDARGHFEMRPTTCDRASLEAELPGWSIYEGSEVAPVPAGGWKDVTIALARRGVLRVHVEDTEGRPIAAEGIRVGTAPSEPGRSKGFSVSTSNDVTHDTGPDGIAIFERALVGKRLSVTIGRYQSGETWSPSPQEWMKNGLIVPEDTSGAEPIVIGPNRELDLVCRRQPDRVLHGIVLRSDRSPASGAAVEVRDVDSVQSSTRLLASTLAGKEGRFTVSVPQLDGFESLRVTAAEKPWEKQNWLTLEDKPMTSAGCLVVDAGRPTDDDLEIVLAPMLAIGGRVSVAGAPAAGGRVTAVPAGSASSLELNAMARPCLCDLSKDGRFRVENLSAGKYDLFVECTSAGARFEQRFADMVSGRTDVELVVDSRAQATVRIRGQSSYGVVAKLIVMHGRRNDRWSGTSPGPELPLDSEVRSLAAWPCEAPINLVGSGGSSRIDKDHSSIFLFDQAAGSEAKVKWQGVGWSYFGIQAELADGRHCFPMSTGLVHVGAGDHTITFDMVPVTDVDGYVRGLDPGTRVEMALVDEAGIPLPLFNGSPATAALLRFQGLRDDGWFHVVGAPLGKFRIRVGTRAQLETGEFVIERPIDIVENGPQLSIDMSR